MVVASCKVSKTRYDTAVRVKEKEGKNQEKKSHRKKNRVGRPTSHLTLHTSHFSTYRRSASHHTLVTTGSRAGPFSRENL